MSQHQYSHAHARAHTHTHLTYHHVDRGETQHLHWIILFKPNPYTMLCTTLLKVGFALKVTYIHKMNETVLTAKMKAGNICATNTKTLDLYEIKTSHICMYVSKQDSNHENILRIQPTRCDISPFIYFCKILCMFQTVFPSIIRNSKLHIQHQVFVRPLLLPAASRRLAAGSSNGLTNT